MPTMPNALWFTIITMSTVGYGDATPSTTAGIIITLVLVISSALYMAVPLGIAGNAFSKVWDDRDWLQLVQHMRERLTVNGYFAQDIPALFKMFGNESGDIRLSDFTRMIAEMGLGIREDRILNLFFTFDSDNSGTIDAMEFVKAIFPSQFVRMYGRDSALVVRDEWSDKNSSTVSSGRARSLLSRGGSVKSSYASNASILQLKSTLKTMRSMDVQQS